MDELQTGDWVRTIHGLGRVVEREHDGQDPQRLAKVELASRTAWLWPGVLQRILPEEEVRLATAALERLDLPADAAERVRGALARPFSRSPRLLDLLWSFAAAPGVVRFFEEEAPLVLAGASPEEAPAAAPAARDETAAPLAPIVHHPRPARRLRAGDWVLAPGPARRLGRVSANPGWVAVQLAAGERWFLPQLLVRVSPEAERLFARVALEEVKLRPADRALVKHRLALKPPRRVPRLLDLLRSFPPTDELARFFEEPPRPRELPPLLAKLEARFAPLIEGLPAGPRATSLDVPDLPHEAALAAWLGLSPRELDAFADRRGWHVRRSPGPLHHYRYLWIAKATGRRLIEAPKEILRGLQRRILDQLVARIPVHDAAHGFVAGRSVRTYASPHAGRALVLRMDLADFFPSITAARVAATFRRVGYAPGVAHLLARLVTNRTPDAVLEDAPPAVQDRLRRAHLPQGAPTSPALANLCAFRLDARLAGLARAFGATYTRYADDLAFSGDGGFRASAEKLRLVVCRIAAEEGFLVRWEKNRWMGASDRQQLAGLVVNERPRPSRAAFDALKATLHNCVVKGPASQDRDRAGDFRNHLLGKVAWFEHVDPARGARLRALFDRIPW